MSDVDIYTLIEARAQTLIRTVTGFTDASIVLGDLRVLDSGAPPYLFLTPGDAPELWMSPRSKDVHFHTDIVIAAIHHHNGEEWTNLKAYRYRLHNLFQKYPTLNTLTDIANGYTTWHAELSIGSRPYPFPPPDEAAGIEAIWLVQEMVLETKVIMAVDGGEYS